MRELETLINELESQKKQIRFQYLVNICKIYFGDFRISGSHYIWKTPWEGNPRINLQKISGGKAKPYQVHQVVQALKRLFSMDSPLKN